MELDWSEQSPRIRLLFRSWQPGDGYEEDIIQAAEARLGFHLPATLRTFYLAWGRRREMTELVDPLLPPDELMLRDGALLFWAENQAVVLWGVQREALEVADPPVVVAWNLEEGLEWTTSHAQLSVFLDEKLYYHALKGGAMHGGVSLNDATYAQALASGAFRRGGSAKLGPHAWQISWLEQQWSKARVGQGCFDTDPDLYEIPILYIRNGQALFWQVRWKAVAGSEEALDEIAEALQITWTHRW